MCSWSHLVVLRLFPISPVGFRRMDFGWPGPASLPPTLGWASLSLPVVVQVVGEWLTILFRKLQISLQKLKTHGWWTANMMVLPKGSGSHMNKSSETREQCQWGLGRRPLNVDLAWSLALCAHCASDYILFNFLLHACHSNNCQMKQKCNALYVSLCQNDLPTVAGPKCSFSVLVSLHWFSVHFQIDFKIVFVFKYLHGLAPIYLTDLLQSYAPSQALRSADQSLMVSPNLL